LFVFSKRPCPRLTPPDDCDPVLGLFPPPFLLVYSRSERLHFSIGDRFQIFFLSAGASRKGLRSRSSSTLFQFFFSIVRGLSYESFFGGGLVLRTGGFLTVSFGRSSIYSLPCLFCVFYCPVRRGRSLSSLGPRGASIRRFPRYAWCFPFSVFLAALGGSAPAFGLLL